VHHDDRRAVEPTRHHRACVERRVFQSSDDGCGMALVRARLARYQPSGLRQRRHDPSRSIFDPTNRVDALGERLLRAVATLHVVEHDCSVGDVSARPVPTREGMFERLVASVRVDIGGAEPAQHRPLQHDLDSCARRDRAPPMPAMCVEHERRAGNGLRMNPHLAPHAARDRHTHFVDRDRQRVIAPREGARADRQGRGRAVNGAAAAFGERPPLVPLAVDRDIERAVIERVGGAARARPSVVWREDAADEGDQCEAVAPVVAERVDVPPRIAPRRDGLVEARFERRLIAAIRPDSAAIGTPGPGWTLPPAR